MPKLRYYISGHGLGHASRSCQIINSLRRRHPQLAVEVVSPAHPWFLREFLDPTVPVRRESFDLGVIQRDSLQMEEAETLHACRRLWPQWRQRAEREAAALRPAGVTLVVSDIPAAPLLAADRAGVPGVVLGNFSWDWIYAGLAERHPGFDDVIDAFRAAYALAERMLRLPFHGGTEVFRQVEDLPLVARRAQLDRAAVCRRLGLDPARPLGLISFGGFGLAGADLAALPTADWQFISAETYPGVLAVSPSAVPYPELVRAADAVITKPGYGIVSEAIAHGTAVLYAERGDFREQALLVAGLHRYARARRIGPEALRRGDWAEPLAALLAQPLPAQALSVDGDLVAADRLARLAGA